MENPKTKKHFIIQCFYLLYILSTFLPLAVHLVFIFIAIRHKLIFGRVLNYGLPHTLIEEETGGLWVLFHLYDLLIVTHMLWILIALFLVTPAFVPVKRTLSIIGLFALAISILIFGCLDPFGIWRYIND